MEARLPESSYFEFDLNKIKRLLGYQPRHDVQSIGDTAEAMRRGEKTGVVPTGVRFGGRASRAAGLCWGYARLSERES